MIRQAGHSAASTAAARPTGKVLIVDDDDDVAQFIARIVSARGYEPLLGRTPREFVENFSADVSMVFLDLVMPQMDGIEMIRFFADSQVSARVVLMSGYSAGVLAAAEQLAQERGLDVGASLSKPIDIEALSRALDESSEQRGLGIADRGPGLSAVELARAIADGELFVEYQPKWHLHQQTFTGAEVLVRWQHPRHGVLPPDRFIGIAEETGLVDDLTLYVMRQAAQQCRAWQAAGRRVPLSINVSFATLGRLELSEAMLQLTREYGLDPGLLTIEVTETALTRQVVTALDNLTRLRVNGFNVALDDFGTGFASMQQLRRLPFNELKLDRSFIAGMTRSADCRAIVRSTIDLGHRLDMRIVAEGIETTDVGNVLAEMGCDEAQGYLFGRPVRERELKVGTTRNTRDRQDDT